jgi:hypothetical protein
MCYSPLRLAKRPSAFIHVRKLLPHDSLYFDWIVPSTAGATAILGSTALPTRRSAKQDSNHCHQPETAFDWVQGPAVRAAVSPKSRTCRLTHPTHITNAKVTDRVQLDRFVAPAGICRRGPYQPDVKRV